MNCCRQRDLNPQSRCRSANHGQSVLAIVNSVKGAQMNFLIWLVVGGIIGWIASMVMKTDAQQGVVLNVIVGIVGAFLGGLLISPLVGVPSINQNAFSLGAMLVSLVGAIILLAIVNLFRRGKAR